MNATMRGDDASGGTGRDGAAAADAAASDSGPADGDVRRPTERSGAAPGSTRASAVGAGASRCPWCAGGGGELTELRLRVPDPLALNRFWVSLPVHPRHERPVRRFAARFRRDGRRFVFAMIAWIGAVFVFFSIVYAVGATEAARERWEEMFVGPSMTVLGVILLLFPFATSLTTRVVGIRASVLMVRGAGLALTGVGLWKAAEAFL